MTDVGHEYYQDAWCRAHLRVETPDEEVVRILGDLAFFRVKNLDRAMRLLVPLCGRGSVLAALERLGFYNITGLDASAGMLGCYHGSGEARQGDIRAMPFEDASFDGVLVFDGLHHLRLANDLTAALREINRVLASEGAFFCVEPWRTPWMRLLHAAGATPFARRLSHRLDALMTLAEIERGTCRPWVESPNVVMTVLRRFFVPEVVRMRRGRLRFIGRRQDMV